MKSRLLVGPLCPRGRRHVMRRAARSWVMPIGIGAGCGILAGVVGAAQWALTQRDLADWLAEFHASQWQHPGFFDETNVARGTFWFWIGTAVVAALVALVVCALAAFTASRMHGRWLDGMIAAIVTAILGSAIYVMAASLAVATSLDPTMTRDNASGALPGQSLSSSSSRPLQALEQALARLSPRAIAERYEAAAPCDVGCVYGDHDKRNARPA
jgi:hypothetical protein